jgi:hypothetical protein
MQQGLWPQGSRVQIPSLTLLELTTSHPPDLLLWFRPPENGGVDSIAA